MWQKVANLGLKIKLQNNGFVFFERFAFNFAKILCGQI